MNRPARLPELTGIRGLAALWVWLYHCWTVAGYPDLRVGGASGLKLTPLFSAGWVGVDLFFVLSGFVLLWPFIGEHARKFSFAEFMRRRALRVLPAYYAQIAILVSLAAAGFIWDLPDWKNLLAHLFMLHNLRADWSSALNGPWWTLPVEWQFYLLFPLLLVLLRRQATWRIVLGMVMLTVAWRYGSFQWLQLHASGAPGSTRTWLLGQLPGYLCEFFFGMAAAWMVAKKWPDLEQLSGRDRLSSGGLVLAAILLLSWVYMLDANADTYWQGHWLLFVWNPVVGLIFALLLISLALGGGLARRMFGNKLMLWLGEISYSLYLWHFIVLDVMTHFGWLGGPHPRCT